MDLADRHVPDAPERNFINGSTDVCSSEGYRWNRGSQEFPDICWKDAAEVIPFPHSDLFSVPLQNFANVTE